MWFEAHGGSSSRVARGGKESGLVMDAARLGVPLIVSDHDPPSTASTVRTPSEPATIRQASPLGRLLGSFDPTPKEITRIDPFKASTACF